VVPGRTTPHGPAGLAANGHGRLVDAKVDGENDLGLSEAAVHRHLKGLGQQHPALADLERRRLRHAGRGARVPGAAADHHRRVPDPLLAIPQLQLGGVTLEPGHRSGAAVGGVEHRPHIRFAEAWRAILGMLALVALPLVVACQKRRDLADGASDRGAPQVRRKGLELGGALEEAGVARLGIVRGPVEQALDRQRLGVGV
jgi:hypothetical protein